MFFRRQNTPGSRHKLTIFRVPTFFLGSSFTFLVLVMACKRSSEISPDVLFREVGPIFVDARDPATMHVKHDFTFVNPSSTQEANLTIAQRSCGCAECFISEPTLPPNGRATITVGYAVRAFRSSREETVIITTGLAELPRVTIILRAKVYPRLAESAEREINLTVSPGQMEKTEIVFEAFQPTTELPRKFEVKPIGRGLSVDFTNVVTNELYGEIRHTVLKCGISVACPDPRDSLFGEGEYSGEIDVGLGDVRTRKTVEWRAQRFITATPCQVFLHAANEDSEAVHVQLRSEEPFSVVRCESDCAGIVSKTELGVLSREHVVDVRLRNAGEAAGSAANGRMLLYVDHPGQPIVSIPLFVLW